MQAEQVRVLTDTEVGMSPAEAGTAIVELQGASGCSLTQGRRSKQEASCLLTVHLSGACFSKK